MRRPPGLVPAVDPGTWTQEAVVEALRRWSQTAGQPPRAYEWSSTGRGAASVRWIAEHPRWPSAATVAYHFGSWSDGLGCQGRREAEPHPPGTLEHIFVISGRARLGPLSDPQALGGEDSIRFPGDQPHVYERCAVRCACISS